MRYILENDILRAEIDSLGAELKSVKRKSDEKEYMWYGDKKYWGRTSPVLFPFVGSCNGKEYRYDGKTYPIGQHGFARDMEFALESQTADSIWFALAANEETLAQYPFACVLKIGYGLQFAGLTEVHHHGNTPDTGLAVMDEDIVIPLTDEKVYFTPGFFDRCTYMVEGKQTGEVSLVTPDGTPYVTVDFDTPLFAIWSPEGKNAPFVCIEPWYGRCDEVGFAGSLEERAYGNTLQAGEVFEKSYSIRYL